MKQKDIEKKPSTYGQVETMKYTVLLDKKASTNNQEARVLWASNQL